MTTTVSLTCPNPDCEEEIEFEVGFHSKFEQNSVGVGPIDYCEMIDGKDSCPHCNCEITEDIFDEAIETALYLSRWA